MRDTKRSGSGRPPWRCADVAVRCCVRAAAEFLPARKRQRKRQPEPNSRNGGQHFTARRGTKKEKKRRPTHYRSHLSSHSPPGLQVKGPDRCCLRRQRRSRQALYTAAVATRSTFRAGLAAPPGHSTNILRRQALCSVFVWYTKSSARALFPVSCIRLQTLVSGGILGRTLYFRRRREGWEWDPGRP